MRSYLFPTPEIVPPYSLIKNGNLPQPTWTPPRRYGGDLWFAFSHKVKRRVHLTYCLEYQHWLVLECDPAIVTFCEHPLRIDITIDGNTRHPVFDMWVLLQDGTEQLREIKPSKNVPKSQKQIEAQSFWCRRQGIPYRVLTEKDLPPILVANCRQMVPFLSQNPGRRYKTGVLRRVDQGRGVRMGDLRGATPHGTQHLRHAAVQLLCAGILTAPLREQPFEKLVLQRRNEHGQPLSPLC